MDDEDKIIPLAGNVKFTHFDTGQTSSSRIDQPVKDAAAGANKPEEDVYRKMMDAIPGKTTGGLKTCFVKREPQSSGSF